MLLNKIWRTIKGTSKKDAFYGFLVKLLGENPKDKSLYLLAFRHKSVSLYENGKKINNERLEYLGDAILGAIVTDILFRRFPNQKEGFLTKMRSKIVSRKQLNSIGAILEFDKYLLFNGNNIVNNLLGNCVEAFVGAIYLDFGYEKTKRIVEKRILNKYIDFNTLLKNDENFKSLLVEWAQQEKKHVEFTTSEIFHEGRPYFHSDVFVDGELIGAGEAGSKKEAQQLAAQSTLGKLRKG